MALTRTTPITRATSVGVLLLSLASSVSLAEPQPKAEPVFNAHTAFQSEHNIIGMPQDPELGVSGFPPLWTPSTPIQNPYSESKRVLGKILFWDEQLSSDNTVSCGTCHINSSGGSDPRASRNPGFDGTFMTADDVFGSPGVLNMNILDQYERADAFGLNTQVTPRVSQSNMMGMFAGSLFWDGRAEFNFVDPETGTLMFQSGVAGLEIQATVPILSDVEMAHEGRTWDQVKDKLAAVRPLALAGSIPPDMLDAVLANPSYPELFEDAFGDPAITAVRIAYALGTYERTLVPNQTPWDLWNDGDSDALTVNQLAGLSALQASSCGFCHAAPTFSNFAFMTDGVRPPFEDRGRQEVTGSSSNRGQFKTPSLRNVALRPRLMHNGGLANLDEVFDFYGHRNGRAPFSDNAHFLVQNPILLSPSDEAAAKDFLLNGLTDPRVANETYPFDRPQLYSEHDTQNPELVTNGQVGSGGFMPKMIAVIPPNLGNADFKIGVDFALGGAQAWVAISQSPPTGGAVPADELIGPINLAGMGSGNGYGTLAYPIDNTPSLVGQVFYMQWIIADPFGAGGFVRTPAARVEIFCTEVAPCVLDCVADFNADGLSDFFDIAAYINAFTAQSTAADLNHDGSFDFFDLSEFITVFGQGCP